MTTEKKIVWKNCMWLKMRPKMSIVWEEKWESNSEKNESRTMKNMRKMRFVWVLRWRPKLKLYED